MVFMDGRHYHNPTPAREDLMPWRVGSKVASGVASLRARFASDPPAVDAELLPVGWTPDVDDETDEEVA